MLCDYDLFRLFFYLLSDLRILKKDKNIKYIIPTGLKNGLMVMMFLQDILNMKEYINIK